MMHTYLILHFRIRRSCGYQPECGNGGERASCRSHDQGRIYTTSWTLSARTAYRGQGAPSTTFLFISGTDIRPRNAALAANGIRLLVRSWGVVVLYPSFSNEPLVWALTVAMLGVFIKELVLNSQEQGTPLSFKVRRLHSCPCKHTSSTQIPLVCSPS